MKKLTCSILLAFAISASLFCQAPQSFKYQTVVRDNSGQIIASQGVSFRISIHNGSAIGTIVYQETHAATTNLFGLTNINVGKGTSTVGSFAGIDWESGSKFMETELDINGGSNYLPIGTSELLSVPYALYSGKSPDSHWNSSGNNIYYDNGMVGIGTSSPNSTLHMRNSNPVFLLQGLNDAASFSSFRDSEPTQLQIQKHTSNGGCLIDFDPMPLDGTGASKIRFFRSTNTSGPTHIALHNGNNSTAVSTLLGVNGADSWFQAYGGNFGIGTTTPETPLHVVTSTQYNPSTALYGAKGALFLSHISGSMVLGPYGPAISFSGINTGRRRAAIASVQTTSDPDQVGLAFFTHPGTAASNDEVIQVMVITHGGSVGIGTDTPANGYLLSVDGNVVCEEVLVETSSSWPDYVFEDDYELEKLDELESFIKTNKHLPDIPSAKEVEEKGFHLGDMQTRLVKKVEELTLYTIEQDKLIKDLKNELILIKKEVNKLNTTINH